MVQIPSKINKSSALDPSLKSLLVNSIEGDIRFDEITREIYSTDASIYKIMPICVAIPKTNQDVASVCKARGPEIVCVDVTVVRVSELSRVGGWLGGKA